MITEDQLEQPCLGWFREGGWETLFDHDIAHVAERHPHSELRNQNSLTFHLPLRISLASRCPTSS